VKCPNPNEIQEDLYQHYPFHQIHHQIHRQDKDFQTQNFRVNKEYEK